MILTLYLKPLRKDGERSLFSPPHYFYKQLYNNVLRYFWYRFRQFLVFYWSAVTRFQVHSPFVFDLANAVLEDRRWYYAFRDVEGIRANMLHSAAIVEVTDFGVGGKDQRHRSLPLRQLVRVAASSPRQGRLLFRLGCWLGPERILELGTSAGIGTLYLASAARRAKILSLEGSEACIHIARANLGILGLHHRVEVIPGEFQHTLQPALAALHQVDLVFFDGDHRKLSTLEYFEEVLPHVHARSVLVFDDMYWSPEMTEAWEQIQHHPRVTLTVDCFDLAFVFFNPDIKVKQHFRLVPAAWKPWRMW